MATTPRSETRERNRVVAEIPDFSLGIYSDIFGGFASTQPAAVISRNGAATIQNTYRCCADPNTGALVPLPRGQNGYSAQLIAGNANNTPDTFYPTGHVEDYLLDIVATGQLQYNAVGDEVVATLWGAMINQAGTGSTFRHYVLGKAIAIVGNVDWDFAFSRGDSAVSSFSIPSAMLQVMRTITNGVDPAAADISDFFATFAHTASNVLGLWDTGALTATEQGWTTYDAWETDYEDDLLGSSAPWFYPSVKNTKSHELLGFTQPYGFVMCAHQGRAVLGGFFLNNMDDLTDHVVEFLSYTAVYDLQETGGSFYVPADPPSSFCAIGSMSADELIIIKGYGGAILIRGDLNGDFQLVRLPFVESTGGVFGKALTTPLGLVYLTRRGVYTWAGGDTSENLAPQLDGWFWSIAASAPYYTGVRGGVGYAYPFILVPNSYCLDTRTRAWWRLEDVDTITPFAFYATSPQFPRFYGGKYRKTATDNVLYRFFDQESLAYSYSWQSQPLIETNEYRYEIREIELIAQPHADSATSTVVVTLSGFNEDGDAVTPVSVTFTLDTANERPQRLRKQVSQFTAAYIQVKIVADGNSAVAPKVYGPLRLIGQEVARSPFAS